MNNLLNSIVSNEISVQLVLIVIFGLFFLLVKNKIISILSGISKKTKTELDDIILTSFNTPFTYLIILFTLVILTEKLNAYFNYLDNFNLQTILYTVFILLTATGIIRFLNEYNKKKLFLKNISNDDDPLVIEQTYEITIRVTRVIIIVITVLILMQQYGLSITGLLAFGGVGGLVVGLAAKDLLSNFFGGLMIYFDRPFKVGEFIKSPDRNIEGIVESIGWRLTVVRTFSKNVLYIPNSAFSNIIVENATRMTNRRINEIIGLRYEDLSKIPSIVSDIRKTLNSNPDIDQKNQPVVYFTSFEVSSCDIIVYAFTNTKDWREFLEVKEKVLFEISNIISKNGAEIAFPTTTIDWKKNS